MQALYMHVHSDVTRTNRLVPPPQKPRQLSWLDVIQVALHPLSTLSGLRVRLHESVEDAVVLVLLQFVEESA